MLKVASLKTLLAIGVLASLGTAASADVRLQGAGATFPNPIYQRWVTEYQSKHPDVKIDYQSIGSGGGVKGITERTVDFAGSDAPMSKKELAAAPDPILHIPTVAGAVVPAFNLPDFKGELHLTGELIADIFLGKISRWSDSRLMEFNPGVTLPDIAITPAWRTDGSGTTFVFTNYLVTQSESFMRSVGAGKQVKWPLGQGGKGNEGVAQVVQSTPGAIGYIELNYATANHIAFAAVRNKNGKFVKASPESVSAAGAGAVEQMTSSLAVNIWNQPGDESYPIAAFTYFLVYKDLGSLKDEAKAKALVDFLQWAIKDGGSMAKQMDYAPLAPAVQAKATEAIKGLTFHGKPIAAH